MSARLIVILSAVVGAAASLTHTGVETCDAETCVPDKGSAMMQVKAIKTGTEDNIGRRSVQPPNPSGPPPDLEDKTTPPPSQAPPVGDGGGPPTLENHFATALSEPVEVGATTLPVWDTQGFAAGVKVVIEPGTPKAEVNTIAKDGVAGRIGLMNSISVETPLKFAHAAETTVTTDDSGAPTGGIEDETTKAPTEAPPTEAPPTGGIEDETTRPPTEAPPTEAPPTGGIEDETTKAPTEAPTKAPTPTRRRREQIVEVKRTLKRQGGKISKIGKAVKRQGGRIKKLETRRRKLTEKA